MKTHTRTIRRAIFAFVLSFVWTFPCLAQDTFRITGNVGIPEEPTVIVVSRSEGNLGIQICNDTIRDGRFFFDVECTGPEEFHLSFRSEKYPSYYIKVFGEPGKEAVITGNDMCILAWDIASDDPRQMRHNILMMSAKDELRREFDAQVERTRLRNLRGTIPQDQFQYRMDSLEKVSDTYRIAAYGKQLETMRGMEYSEELMEELHGITVMANIYESYAFLREPALEIFSRLSDEQKNSETGRLVNMCLFPPPPVEIGMAMPDAELTDISGEKRMLADYKGKALLLDFWSSGCGPCIFGMPELKEISEKHGDVLTVISISQDTDKHWKKATDEYGITWVNLNEGSGKALSPYYGVDGIPHQVLITPEGTIADFWTGYADGLTMRKVEAYLKNEAAQVYRYNNPHD